MSSERESARMDTSSTALEVTDGSHGLQSMVRNVERIVSRSDTGFWGTSGVNEEEKRRDAPSTVWAETDPATVR